MKNLVIIATAACTIAGLPALGEERLMESDCDRVSYSLVSEDFFERLYSSKYVPLEVTIAFGDERASTFDMPDEAALTRKFCNDLTNTCTYAYQRSTKCDDPEATAKLLKDDLYACGTGKRRDRTRDELVVRNVTASAVALQPNAFASSVVTAPVAPKASLDDPYYAYQAELERMGALEAWRNIQEPDNYDAPPIITAVVDSGFARVGKDLYPLKGGVHIPCLSRICDGSPTDSNDHGTNMAGTIAARMNKEGIIGVAWNTGVLSIKSFEHGVTTDPITAKAIACAYSKGARVINASFESTEPMTQTRDAIARLQRRAIVVVPAGNENRWLNPLGTTTDPCNVYPACIRDSSNARISNLIVAMSHHKGDFKTDGVSNWGKDVVDIAAPGTTFTTRICKRNSFCYDAPFSSTSTATSFVSGAAALLWSQYLDWTPEQIKWRILENGVSEAALRDRLDGDRRLDLERMMHPVFFTYASADKRISKRKLGSFKTSNAFPQAMCQRETPEYRLAKPISNLPHRPPVRNEQPVPVNSLNPGDLVILKVACLRANGSTISADSIVYTVEE